MIDFRPAGIDDAVSLSEIMQRAFDQRYGEAWTSGQLLGTLVLPATWAELALDAGRPIGFSLARAVADEAELLLVAVDPRQRGQGTGGRLVERAMEAARTRGAVKMHLEVRAGNAPARKLYAKSGFQDVGIRPAYYLGSGRERFDAVTMSRQLG
jgi:ribosomal-protein-alanine N-acetyltransferase